MREVVQFSKSKKLNPRYVKPFDILGRVRTFVYRLALQPDMSSSQRFSDFTTKEIHYILDLNHILEVAPFLIEGNLNK